MISTILIYFNTICKYMNAEKLKDLYKNVVNFPIRLLKPSVVDLTIDQESIIAQLQDESNALLRKYISN